MRKASTVVECAESCENEATCQAFVYYGVGLSNAESCFLYRGGALNPLPARIEQQAGGAALGSVYTGICNRDSGVGKYAFNKMVRSSPHMIVKRTCLGCSASHRTVYYRASQPRYNLLAATTTPLYVGTKMEHRH